MIPNKSNFKFQELTPITGVKPYVIRFWETEFPEISPIASEEGQKLYSRSDVEVILKIKKLLFEDKLSIPEAKMKMGAGEVAISKVEVFNNAAKGQSELVPFIMDTLQLIKEIKAKRNW
jgi:DNA-binding transcriptional MerR regulator